MVGCIDLSTATKRGVSDILFIDISFYYNFCRLFLRGVNMETPGNLNLLHGTLNLSENIRQDTEEPKFSVTFFLLLVLSGLTVFTNALILAAFCVEKKLQTYPNHYIFNITIADLVVGLACMPLRSTILLYNGWKFGRVAGILFKGFQNSILSVSVCGVIAICMDRYLAILYPLRHYRRKSIRKATIVNIGTWALSFGVWMIIFPGWDFIIPNGLIAPSGLPKANYTLTKTTTVLVSILRLFGPFLIITCSYLRLYFRMRHIGSKQLRASLKRKKYITHPVGQSECGGLSEVPALGRIKSNDFVSTSLKETVTVSSISYVLSHSQRQNKDDVTERDNARCQSNSQMNSKEKHVSRVSRCVTKKPQSRCSTESRKAMHTLTFIVLAFFVTWLPNIVNIVIYTISRDLYDVINGVFRFSELCRWISYCNSLINPVAYAMAQPLIRKTILNILFCRKCR